MKIKTIITITTIATLLPLIALAQLDATTNISINRFDLIWSADTYTPFDYQGRNLPTIGSKIIVDAVISASSGNIKSLKYSWFLEDIFQKSKSGYGKDSFYFYVQQRPGGYHTVRVQVFNDDRTIFEEKTIKIPVTEPEIVVYSLGNNSHFSNQANKNSIDVFNDKLSLIVKPYFFSINKLTDLTFKWTLGSQEPIISSDYDASVLDLTIANANKYEAESNLWIDVSNPQESRQKADQTIILQIH
jgi:hypothetical protein